jgi:hypothetical protein
MPPTDKHPSAYGRSRLINHPTLIGSNRAFHRLLLLDELRVPG